MSTDGPRHDPTKIWTTLLTNRAYFRSVHALDHDLRKSMSKYQLKVMITRNLEADTEIMEYFANAGISTIVISQTQPTRRDGKMTKGTWEKLAPWAMTDYERIVFIENGHSMRRNVDELMTITLPEFERGMVLGTKPACTCSLGISAHCPKDQTPETCVYARLAAKETRRSYLILDSRTVVLQVCEAQVELLTWFPAILLSD
ncbi:hypothetical protein QBC37DRAFT_323465, partial [Rhypophila decipiens]